MLKTILGAIAGVLATSAYAQSYPSQPIKFIVPYTQGTGMDTIARVTGAKLAARLGQPVVVENRPGASGNIGAAMVAKAPADGHTLMVSANTMLMAASTYKNVPYDVLQDFTPITMAAYGTMALVATTKSGVDSVPALVQRAKANPNKMTYGSPGVGTPHHLAMELFKLQTKTDLKHIPYRGTAGATQDLTGGHVTAGFQVVHVALPLVNTGQLRFLGVASKERVAAAPDVPTLDSAGVKGFDVPIWYGVLAPAGTPPDILTRYNTTLNEILRSPQVVEKLAKQGLITVGGSAASFGTFLKNERDKWEKVVTDAGIPKVE